VLFDGKVFYTLGHIIRSKKKHIVIRISDINKSAMFFSSSYEMFFFFRLGSDPVTRICWWNKKERVNKRKYSPIEISTMRHTSCFLFSILSSFHHAIYINNDNINTEDVGPFFFISNRKTKTQVAYKNFQSYSILSMDFFRKFI